MGEGIGKMLEASRVLTGGNPDKDRQNVDPESNWMGGCPTAPAQQVTHLPCLQTLTGRHSGEPCRSSYALMWSKDAAWWSRGWIVEPSSLGSVLGSATLLTLESYLPLCVSVFLSEKWTSVFLIKSLWRLNVLMCMKYLEEDQEFSKDSSEC